MNKHNITKIMKSTVYSTNFRTGQLEPITAAGLLPVGAVVTYEDRANPRRRFVVTGADFDAYGHGQACVCEDGHTSTVSKNAIQGPGGWHDTGEVLNAEQMKAFIAEAAATKEREDAERAIATKKTNEARDQRKAAAIAANPHLERVKPGAYATAKLGAANIRTELKRAFPGVKFSVRSDTFSGGDSIDIAWDLGPTDEQVSAITDKYQDGHFNGMEDIYETDRENVWPDLFGGAKYVHTHRHQGDAHNVVAAALCHRWGLPIPANKDWWTVRRADDHSGHNVGVIARQIIDASAYPVGAVITGIKDTGETAGHWHELIRTTYTAPAATTAATAPEAATVGGSLDITVRHNAAKNGIEISFAAKPAPAVLADLKANGWRWSRFSSCWYHTATATAAQFAAKLANLAADEARNLISKTERAGIDHFDMQVEDNMAAACGL